MSTFFPVLLAILAQDVDPDVVVTATRSPTSIDQETAAISVIAVSGPDMALAHHPAELINRAAGGFVQAGSGQEHLTAIRSPVLTGGAGAGSFLYLQDGVPLRSAGFANVNGLFDAQTPFAQRIEVLRGPGEVAYGSNAVHGTINVISADPLGEAPSGVRIQAGAFDRYSATATVAGTHGNHGWRAGIHGYTDGGYRAASGLGQLKVNLSHGWDGGDVRVTSRASFHQLDQETAGFVIGENAFQDDDVRRSNPNPDAFRDSRQGVISTQIDFASGGWAVQVQPYALWADMRFRQHFLPSQAIEENNHHAVGIQTSARTALGPNTSLLIGLDAEAARGELSEEQFIPTVFSFTQGVHYDYAVRALSVAPFARVHHALTERLSAQLGGRVTHTRYDYDNRTDDGVVGRFLRLPDRQDDFTAVTGKLALQYQLSSQTRLYASLSRGSRPPQTTDLYRLQINQSIDDIEPETLDMAEIGVRHHRDDLTLSVVGFAGRKDNFLFRDADGFTVSDGVTLHRGLEVEGRWQLAEGVSAFAAGTYAQHTYDFNRLVGSASESITAGDDVDTAPRHIWSGGITLTPHPRVTMTGRLQHVGEYFTDAANTNQYSGHTLGDLSLRLQAADRLVIDVAVRNISDERFATRADFAFGNDRFFPGEERHVVVGAAYQW